MFKLKKESIFFKIILFIGLGLFLITNSHKIMAINVEDIPTKTNMQIHDIFLEKVEDISYYVINNNYFECFTSLTLEYPCYNGTNTQHELSWMIKPPYYWIIQQKPVKLLCVVFDKGIRDKMDDKYTLEDLIQMGNGASNMYIFWLKKPLNLNSKINETKNIKDINKQIYNHLEIKFQKKEIGKINNQLNLLQNQKSQLENQLSSNKKDLNKLEHEINQKQAEVESKKQQLIEQINLSKEEKKQLNSEINTLKTDINQEKVNFEVQLSLKEEEIDQLKNKLKLLKAELENEKIKYQKIIITLEQKINTYSGILDSLYKKIFHF
ncbi:SAP05-like protein [Candidatus Phytoplasma solani]|uniref:SVM family protein n=1 Tax=Candidatus Phytoplasma solani TaxID=69896 RepID=UPI0032DACB84